MGPRASSAGFKPAGKGAARPSVLGALGNKGFQRFAISEGRDSLGSSNGDRSTDSSGQMLELGKDMEERIAKLVEAEVERRLAQERERLKQEQASKPASTEEGTLSVPPGVLTPLLKKHQDLDNELNARLKELERKL
jgi:kinesin family protein 22